MSEEPIDPNPQDVDSFFKLVEKHIGISLDSSKSYLISSRLTPLLEEHGVANLKELLQFLSKAPLGPLHWEAFEAMTTNETSFFRDIHPFEVLKKTILPALIQERQHTKMLNIWSAAASTGQESYSIAILLREQFPELNHWKVNILATDISELALNKASLGIYNPTEIARGLTGLQIQHHFTKLANGSYQIHPDIRAMIQFKHMNLLGDWSWMPKFDLILIRNVLIYFNQDLKAKVVKKLHGQLSHADACLILGSSESILFDKAFNAIQLDRVSYYQKANLPS